MERPRQVPTGRRLPRRRWGNTPSGRPTHHGASNVPDGGRKTAHAKKQSAAEMRRPKDGGWHGVRNLLGGPGDSYDDQDAPSSAPPCCLSTTRAIRTSLADFTIFIEASFATFTQALSKSSDTRRVVGDIHVAVQLSVWRGARCGRGADRGQWVKGSGSHNGARRHFAVASGVRRLAASPPPPTAASCLLLVVPGGAIPPTTAASRGCRWRLKPVASLLLMAAASACCLLRPPAGGAIPPVMAARRLCWRRPSSVGAPSPTTAAICCGLGRPPAGGATPAPTAASRCC